LTLTLDGVDVILSLQTGAVAKAAASFFDLGANAEGFETPSDNLNRGHLCNP
jgi:hypothetical protein